MPAGPPNAKRGGAAIAQPKLPGIRVPAEKANDGDSFVDVGRVRLAHGLRGDLYIAIPAGQMAWLDNLIGHGFLYLRNPVDRDLLKFSVHSLKPHHQKGRQGLIAATKEIRDRNTSELFRGWNLEIPKDLLVAQQGEEPYLSELLGFRVYDQAGEVELGQVVGFSSNGAQDLLMVRTPQGDFGVPFVAPFFPKIDYTLKTMQSDLPEGILSSGDDGGA